MPPIHSVIAQPEDQGERLDSFFSRRLGPEIAGLSRSRVKSLIEQGLAQADGRTITEPSHRVKPGTAYLLSMPEAAPAEPVAQEIPLTVLFEDAHLIVIDKPAGLVVHPAPGNPDQTLVNALLNHCGDSLAGIGGVRRPGIVHRLDKDTTGLMVVAKNDHAHASLSAQFADHGRTGAMERGYLAFSWGLPHRPHGTINAPLDRHPHARDKMAVRPRGREAITHYEVQESFVGRDGKPVASLIACHLETGRTHQIRVHLAHLGHTLLGDAVYGPHFKTKANQLAPGARAALEALGRQALHAYLLVIEHPRTGEILRWESELPEDLSLLREALRAAL